MLKYDRYDQLKWKARSKCTIPSNRSMNGSADSWLWLGPLLPTYIPKYLCFLSLVVASLCCYNRYLEINSYYIRYLTYRLH